jgi:hypothetical protein
MSCCMCHVYYNYNNTQHTTQYYYTNIITKDQSISISMSYITYTGNILPTLRCEVTCNKTYISCILDTTFYVSLFLPSS